jgi:hypothetical protein
MNSDPYDSAAWRTFGMLDADESAIFEEAMRHDPLLRGAYLEMDRLSAAVAAATTAPVAPQAGQLERLRSRLGLDPVAKRGVWWFGISGWAAAAALALMMVLGTSVREDLNGVAQNPPSSPATDGSSQATAALSPPPAGTGAVPEAAPPSAVAASDPAQDPATAEKWVVKASSKAETKRLVQEIAVLRENLEQFQRRDRILFDPVPGMAVPVVMTMKPPGVEEDDLSPTLTAGDDTSPIVALLGEVLASVGQNRTAGIDGSFEATGNVPGAMPMAPGSDTSAMLSTADDGSGLAGAATPEPVLPNAIPIYDMARDSGTLVVNNLPQAGENEAYNLWVTTESGAAPIYVGSLPETSATGVDSFDFSLGSTTVLPSGFVLTRDATGAPQRPHGKNTVLQGPPVPQP